MTRFLHYREFATPEALCRHVHRVWHLAFDADSGHVETVYPNGCCELIGHRKTPMHATGIRRFVWLPRSFAGASGSRA